MPQKSTQPLPPAAARRQAEVLLQLIPAIESQVRTRHPADVAIGRFFRAHRLYGARDRRFFSQTVFSYFRWKGWLAGQPPHHAIALAYLLDATIPHPAIELLLADRPLGPLGRLTISEKAAALAGWLQAATPPCLTQLVPDWLPAVLATDRLDLCIASFQVRPPVWLRVQPDKVREVRRHCDAAPHPSVAGALSLGGHPNLDLLRRNTGSCFEVQDLASQCVVPAGAPKPGEMWWDVCAGAGGKSLQLAGLLGDKGRVFATDVRPAALRELTRRANISGIGNISQSVLNATMHDPEGGPFDGVLVDAPCSGIGTWSRNPDMRWRTSQDDILRHAETQALLLHRAARHLKPGGTLVYAVCTITQLETSNMIHQFLQSQSNLALWPRPHPLTGEMTNGEIRIWPWDGPCDGMYIAVFRKHSQPQKGAKKSAFEQETTKKSGASARNCERQLQCSDSPFLSSPEIPSSATKFPPEGP